MRLSDLQPLRPAPKFEMFYQEDEPLRVRCCIFLRYAASLNAKAALLSSILLIEA